MEEALMKRVMPNSLEAEQSVIGSMIMDREAIIAASEILLKEDFYHQQYGVLFEAMVELFNEGQPADLVTLQNRLKEKDVPPEVSSLEYVRDLVAAVPTSANVKYYAQIVKEKAVLRKLIKVTENIENECYLGKESLEVILEDTEKRCLSFCRTAAAEIMCRSSRWSSIHWKRSNSRPRPREMSPVSRPDLWISIIRWRDFSRPT